MKGNLLAGSGVLEKAVRSEQVAFLRLYDEYFPRVYNYARYRCGDAETADDLTAQTFERALAHLQTYDPQKAPFGAWLFGIARNLVNDHRATARRRECLPLDTCAGHPAPAASPRSG